MSRVFLRIEEERTQLSERQPLYALTKVGEAQRPARLPKGTPGARVDASAICRRGGQLGLKPWLLRFQEDRPLR